MNDKSKDAYIKKLEKQNEQLTKKVKKLEEQIDKLTTINETTTITTTSDNPYIWTSSGGKNVSDVTTWTHMDPCITLNDKSITTTPNDV